METESLVMVKFISLMDMQAMPIEQQDAIGQRYLAGGKKTRNENSELKEDQKNVAKWLFLLSARLSKAREAHLEASNTTLDDYFKRYGKTDGEIPGHGTCTTFCRRPAFSSTARVASPKRSSTS